jgi:hypothetical protein
VLNRIAGMADRNMTSWQHWAYFNEDTSGPRPDDGVVFDPALPPDGTNLKRDKLEVLARAYPRVVAGTPKRWSFDRPTRRFDFSYSTRRADGTGSFSPSAAAVTEVFVPEIHYGDAYRVRVAGAEVLSRPGARGLLLRACPGAEAVELTVTDDPAAPTPACQARTGADAEDEAARRPGAPSDPKRDLHPGSGGAEAPSPTAGRDGSAESASGGSLPFTGWPLAPLLLSALAALAAGGAAQVLVQRRRR